MPALIRCRLVGRITHADFVARHRWRTLKHWPRACVAQDRLPTRINAHMQIPRDDIETLAQLRMANDRRRGVVEGALPGTHAPIVCDRMGVTGELAASRFYGTRLQHDGPDAGFDFVFGDGTTCDVKTTHWPQGVLYFDKLADFKADWALLVVVEATLDALN